MALASPMEIEFISPLPIQWRADNTILVGKSPSTIDYSKPSPSITFDDRLPAAENALREVCEECREENWDGYGAKAVDEISSLVAAKFLTALPVSVPLPEMSVDPDGEVCLEWHVPARGSFSISVGADKELSYAGLFGPNKVYGSEYSDDEVPAAILQQLARLYRQKS